MVISLFTSATEHASAVRDRHVSCSELTACYLSQIQRHNRALNAIVIGNEADATRAATERDAEVTKGLLRGPLHGVPVTVKEAFDMKGLKTTVNFSRLKNNVAADDAFVVKRLKEAGATILGKTNIPTMLSDHQSFGPVYATANNPYDITRTPGGSTGGGAAAVAAGLTTFEIGSDIGGSLRVPAHFCGVFGLKPTENAAMHGEGHVPPAPGSRAGYVSMACIGPLARTMDDIALAWTIINQPTWKYFSHLPRKPRTKNALSDYRVAWFDDLGTVACGDETRTLLGQFVRDLERGGVKAERKPFEDQWLDRAHAVWAKLFGFVSGQDAPWLIRQIMKRRFAAMGKGAASKILAQLKAGLDLDFKEFSRTLKERVEITAELQRRFDDYDFIISPVAAGPAFPHNHQHSPIRIDARSVAYIDYAMPFVAPYNGCGNPVLVVPGGMTSGALPVGFQIAAPHYAEDELIHFGTLVERLGRRFVAPAGY
jgi:amidase